MINHFPPPQPQGARGFPSSLAAPLSAGNRVSSAGMWELAGATITARSRAHTAMPVAYRRRGFDARWLLTSMVEASVSMWLPCCSVSAGAASRHALFQ